MKDKENKKFRDIKLIEVTTVQGPVEAEVIKSFLESCGISTFLKGLVVQSVHAFSADGLGKIKVMVDEKDYQKAKSLLEEKNS
jgi:CRISPR/Cas system-associated protein Csm6